MTGQSLELLYGIGDGASPPENAGQWLADTAQELVTNIGLLLPPARSRWPEMAWVDKAPNIEAKTVEEVVTFVSKPISVRIQSTAVANARSYDWIRARRLTYMIVGLLGRAFAVASPQEYRTNRDLFRRLAALWSRFLLPVFLVVAKNPEQHQTVTKMIFAAAARIRRGVKTDSMIDFD